MAGVLVVNGINNTAVNWKEVLDTAKLLTRNYDEGKDNVYVSYNYEWEATRPRESKARGLATLELLDVHDENFAEHLDLSFNAINRGKETDWIDEKLHKLIKPDLEEWGSTWQMPRFSVDGQAATGKQINAFKAEKKKVWYAHSNGCRILVEYMKRIKNVDASLLPDKIIFMSPALSENELKTFAATIPNIPVLITAGASGNDDAGLGQDYTLDFRYLAEGKNVHSIVLGVKGSGEWSEDPESIVTHHKIGASVALWNSNAKSFVEIWGAYYGLWHDGKPVGRGKLLHEKISLFEQVDSWLNNGEFKE